MKSLGLIFLLLLQSPAMADGGVSQFLDELSGNAARRRTREARDSASSSHDLAIRRRNEIEQTRKQIQFIRSQMDTIQRRKAEWHNATDQVLAGLLHDLEDVVGNYELLNQAIARQVAKTTELKSLIADHSSTANDARQAIEYAFALNQRAQTLGFESNTLNAAYSQIQEGAGWPGGRDQKLTEPNSQTFFSQPFFSQELDRRLGQINETLNPEGMEQIRFALNRITEGLRVQASRITQTLNGLEEIHASALTVRTKLKEKPL